MRPIAEWFFLRAQKRRRSFVERAKTSQPREKPMMELGYGAYGLVVTAYLVLAAGMYYAGSTWLYDLLRPDWLSEAASFSLEGYPVFLLALLLPVILLAAVILQGLLSFTGRLGNSLTAKDVAQVFQTTGSSAAETESLLRSVDLGAVQRMTLRRLLFSWLVVTAVLFPVMYQAAGTYFTSAFPTVLRYRHVWNFSVQTLRTEDIASIRVGVDDTGSHLDPVYEIRAADGRTFDLWDIGLNPTPTEDLVGITRVLVQQGGSIEFDPLPDLARLRPEIQTLIREAILEIQSETRRP